MADMEVSTKCMALAVMEVLISCRVVQISGGSAKVGWSRVDYNSSHDRHASSCHVARILCGQHPRDWNGLAR